MYNKSSGQHILHEEPILHHLERQFTMIELATFREKLLELAVVVLLL